MSPIAKARLDGDDLRGMIDAATKLFERHVESINALNVFPVPDGDTGINMFLTLKEVARRAGVVHNASAGEVASAMARGALMEARGNSGVILCQIFKGIAEELEGKPDFGPRELASAFQNGTEQAYTAVAEPVEGTLLTVIRRVAETAKESADAGAAIPAICEAVCMSARETVALTPTMLPVLREAGVVDAGGQGLYVILEGIRSYLNGNDAESVEVSTPAPIGAASSGGAVSREFLDSTDEIQYGYCTQFLISGRDMDPTSVREAMTTLGQSTVVVGDEVMVKVHLHTEDPGPALSHAVSLGTLGQVKIQNMDEQHREYSDDRLVETLAPATESLTAAISVVAVALGQGLEDVFSELGASEVLAGGDTMNPSVQEILDAVQRVPSENVLFLPNNRNVIPAAKQAADASAKCVALVPTVSIPQGIAAMLEFNPSMALSENASNMERRLSSVRTGEICRAVRPVSLGGVSVAEGQLIGLLDHDLVVAGNEPTEVLVSLLQRAEVSDGELVTLYWGERLTKYDALAAQKRLNDTFPGTEFEVVAGGQPHYQYIVSVE